MFPYLNLVIALGRKQTDSTGKHHCRAEHTEEKDLVLPEGHVRGQARTLGLKVSSRWTPGVATTRGSSRDGRVFTAVSAGAPPRCPRVRLLCAE